MSIGRRIPVVALTALTAVVLTGLGVREAPEPAVARFSALGDPTTPFVPLTDRVTSTFYCAGVPAAAEGAGGELVVVNPSDTSLAGQVTTFTVAGAGPELPISVPARGTTRLDLGVLAADGYVGSIVEVAGSGAVVEQRAVLPEGSSVAPCSNSASTEWVLASGSSLDGTAYDLVLTNPFPDAAVLDMTFITATDTRTPNEFQNFVVPARSVRVVDVDQIARDEPELSLVVTSRRGRFVAAHAQQFSGAGASVALGAPAAARQWLLADGRLDPAVTESITIVNTGEQTAEVDLTFFPATPVTDVLTPFATQVAPGRSVTIDPAVLGLPFTGRYGLSVAGAGAAGIVVERRASDDERGTAVVLGSRFGSARWWVASGVAEDVAAALVVFNASGLEGQLSVGALGPGGVDALPGFEAVPLGPAATVTLDLPASAAGLPLVVEATGLSLIVEQRLPNGAGGRSGALALPE